MNLSDERKNLPQANPERNRKGRPKAEPKRQKTFYLPVALVRELRVSAAVQERPQSEIVTAALAKYLRENTEQP